MERKNEYELREYIYSNKPSDVEHYIIECKDDCRYRLDDINTLEKGKELFDRLNISYNQTEYDTAYSVLTENYERAIQYEQDVEDILKDKQKNCEHNWKYDGQDSHYDYYYCNKCGAYDKR